MITMFPLTIFFVYFGLSTAFAGNPQPREARPVPPDFSLIGPTPQNFTLTLRLALVQNDRIDLQNTLMDVSTPSSPRYGQYLSKEEVEKFVAPSEESTGIVNSWLLDNNLNPSKLSPTGDWLSIDISAGKANDLLNADFSLFQHVETGTITIRTLKYSIPAELIGHLDFVHPTTTFPVGISYPAPLALSSSRLIEVDIPSACTLFTVPQCLQDLYGIPGTTATQSTNTIGISAFGDKSANIEDLQQFLQLFRPDLPSSTEFIISSVDGGVDNRTRADAATEPTLDTQYTIGIASGVTTSLIVVGTDNTDGIDGFLDEILFLLNETAPPQVLTTSAGFTEDKVDFALASNMCNVHAQLGARGVSVIFASGDGGVSGVSSQNCTTFLPVFPATCPFVTSVGGTTGFAPEIAANFSSGGFSNYFETPDYQINDIGAYIANLGEAYAGLYNRSGRGFPDVSAQSRDFVIVRDAQLATVSGTSCASPTFASLIALLNDALIAAGKPALGFINPLLYANPSILTDIMDGSNPGCGTDGFNATNGWDPVTGLGTPNFTLFQALLGL
ncbi:family S53 protease [Obba rivulosa]|uniref:Family S53 protease n=1 Tax=Obba rivulosa TaxID=1052685 RepID=A0A8E2AMD0_9APHY|nr:family S53 protease [Obba rivulosa]